MDKQALRLVSKDGCKMYLPLELAKRLAVFKEMMQDLGSTPDICGEQAIPLPIHSTTLEVILELLRKTQDAQDAQDARDARDAKTENDGVQDLLRSLTHGQLKALANALNFLQADDLLAIICTFIKDLLDTMSQPQVNEFLKR